MHKRREIRDRVVELLIDRTSCGDRVFSNRGRAFYSSELPSITVYTETESADFLLDPVTDLRRTLTLVVECAAIQQSHIDNEIDEICAEIEAVLRSKTRVDGLYNGLIQSVRLTDTQIGVVEQSKNVIGSARLSFEVVYDTA